MFNIVLFGPPGAGKGTQSEMLIEKYNLVHLSTGDLLRKEISEGTELGMKAKSIIEEGKLVPDNVVISMIESRLRIHRDANGFIFDGFPRTVAQAEALDDMLDRHQTSVTGMISLVVPEEELIQRLLLRGRTSGRSDDNDEEVIRKRINEYHQKTSPVADYYRKKGKLFEVDGVGEIDNIFDRISNRIASFSES